MRTKHLLFAAVLAAMFAVSAIAQNDPTGRYAMRDRNDEFVINITRAGSAFAVAGSYTLDGQTCQVSGTYYSATRKIKAQCRDGRSAVPVDGIIEFRQGEMSTSAYLTLTIHNRTKGTYRDVKAITGAWRVTQTAANGARYTGTFRITQNGTKLSGRAEWDNHTNGEISGTVWDSGVQIIITYAEGLVGTYHADLTNGGNTMANGRATSNRGGGSVSWSATKTQ